MVSLSGIIWYQTIGTDPLLTAWIYDINPQGFRISLANEGNEDSKLTSINYNNKTLYGYAIWPKLPVIVPMGSDNVSITIDRRLVSGSYSIELFFENFDPIHLQFDYIE